MSDEAKLYLSARRPNGQDDADPAIAAALTAAESDPTLAAWAGEQRSTDATLAAKLRSVQPPPGLRETILAGGAVSRRSWWQWFNARGFRTFRNSELLAAAAVVLLLGAAVLINSFRGGHDNPDWQKFAAQNVTMIEDGRRNIAHTVGDMTGIRQWLADNTCPAPATLPPPVRDLSIYGCSKVMWRGQPMSIVCFDLGGGREVHLVSIAREHLPVSPPMEAPVFANIEGYETASWSEGTVSMMLIGKIPQAELKKLFRAESVAVIALLAFSTGH